MPFGAGGIAGNGRVTHQLDDGHEVSSFGSASFGPNGLRMSSGGGWKGPQRPLASVDGPQGHRTPGAATRVQDSGMTMGSATG